MNQQNHSHAEKEETNISTSNDEDKLFASSIVPKVGKIGERYKSMAQIEILQVLAKFEPLGQDVSYRVCATYSRVSMGSFVLLHNLNGEMIKLIKGKMSGKVKGDFAYSRLVFRLAGLGIKLAVKNFQSFIPNSETLKELKTAQKQVLDGNDALKLKLRSAETLTVKAMLETTIRLHY